MVFVGSRGPAPRAPDAKKCRPWVVLTFATVVPVFTYTGATALVFPAPHWLRLPSRWRQSSGGHHGCCRAVATGVSAMVLRDTVLAGDGDEVSPVNNEMEVLWLDVIEHKREWYDLRTAKFSGEVDPSAPDFKHVNSSVSLWLNDPKNPEWVRDEFENNYWVGSDAVWNHILMHSLEWVDYREAKTHGWVSGNFPDFINCFDSRIAWLTPDVFAKVKDLEEQLSTLPFAPATREGERRVMLEHMRRHSTEWECYWEAKEVGWVSSKFPDFRHTRSKEVAWMSPEEVPTTWLSILRACKFSPPMKAAIFHILRYPHEWIDKREGSKLRRRRPDVLRAGTREGSKLPGRRPEFLHARTHRAVWLPDSLPRELTVQLEKTTFPKASPDTILENDMEVKWRSFFDKQGQGEWFDMRKEKGIDSRRPDFKHKSGVGL